MLATPAPFPHAGSDGFLRGTAQRVTVIQHNAAGTSTVKLHPPRFMDAAKRLEWANRGASLTRQVETADIYETEQLAAFCGKPPKAHRARTSRKA